LFSKVKTAERELAQSIYGSIQEYAGFDREAWLE
jgi:hypothetical protein